MTAEAAVALPALVLFAMALLWALLAASAEIECVDAARAGARAAARQEPADVVQRMARQAAPGGARITVSRRGDLVHVLVVAHPPGPRALTFELRHEAVAMAEDAQDAVGVNR
ncbi:TadE family type IV pilus minor pilin [Streptomyces sp. NPDC052040]|uniref:TadE family type IV pilus minor pilin n=1 Tax=unclassified Streptomyces TaxID=2593676 RepID=UPI0037D8593E